MRAAGGPAGGQSPKVPARCPCFGHGQSSSDLARPGSAPQLWFQPPDTRFKVPPSARAWCNQCARAAPGAGPGGLHPRQDSGLGRLRPPLKRRLQGAEVGGPPQTTVKPLELDHCHLYFLDYGLGRGSEGRLPSSTHREGGFLPAPLALV